MIEIRQPVGESEVLRIEGEDYALVRKGDMPVKKFRALGKLYTQMQEAMKGGDMDAAVTALITCVTMFSTAPPEVLENLTMTQLFEIVAAFNEAPVGADGANPT